MDCKPSRSNPCTESCWFGPLPGLPWHQKLPMFHIVFPIENQLSQSDSCRSMGWQAYRNGSDTTGSSSNLTCWRTMEMPVGDTWCMTAPWNRHLWRRCLWSPAKIGFLIMVEPRIMNCKRIRYLIRKLVPELVYHHQRMMKPVTWGISFYAKIT